MIRFAGVDLLLEDVDGVLAGFLGKHLSLEDLHLFGSFPVATQSPTRGPRSVRCLSLGLPVVNYPPPPPLRINSLWWPTGATRWARFVGLVDDAGLESILEEIGGPRDSEYLPAQLTLADARFEAASEESGFSTDGEGRVALTTEMYALTPRPVAAAEGEGRLWLLPLVDERYWWQFRSGEFNPPSWSAAFALLAEVLGVDEVERETPSASYGVPDPTEAHRDFQNAALLLDAVAHSVGCRVVRRINGTVEAIRPAASESLLEQNADGSLIRFEEIAGGDHSDKLPRSLVAETVAVVFRDSEASDVLNTIEVGIDEIDPESTAAEGVKTYFTPSEDAFVDDEPSAASTNLAEAIAADYYAWAAKQYRRSFVGLKKWELCGFDDATEWSFGRRMPDGSYQAETRVQSLPGDVGVDVLLNQASEAAVERCVGAGNPGGGGEGGCCSCICLDDATITACSAVPKLPERFRVAGNQSIGGQILEHDSTCAYESAQFRLTLCGIDYGLFHWELTVAEGIDASTLSLVSDGDAEDGVDGSTLEVTYRNKWHFDPMCGTMYGITERWTINENAAHLFPCEICLVPDADACPQCSPCQNCDGLPVYEWDGEAWQLLDECDCLEPDMPTAPVSPGTFIGELSCGTCVAAPCPCSQDFNMQVNAAISDNACAGQCMNFSGGSGNQLTPQGGCVWENGDMTGCGITARWRLTFIGGEDPDEDWQLELIDTGTGLAIATYLFHGTFDCSGTGSSVFTYDSDNGNTQCNWSIPATMTVQLVP